MRNVNINLNNILSLISCASDYGFENDILFSAFAKMIDRKLTNEDIELYAMSVGAVGYSIDDYEEVKERLKKFKNKYCK